MTAPQDPNSAGNHGEQQGWSAPPPPPQQQWAAPQQPQEQWGAPQQPQQQWGQPQQPQEGWSQPPQQGWSTPESLTPPSRPKRHGKAIALTAAAVVLIGGGVATYAAVSSSDTAAGGSKSPQAAVQKMFSDLQKGDLIGALDDLPPGERAAVSTPFKDAVNQLKRNDVVKPDANLNKVSGVTFSATGLTYAPGNVVVNDHVQVVKLTDGKVTVSGNTARLPFTQDFLRAVGAGQISRSGTQTVDIGAEVQRSHKPVRIATQRVDGKWYPSLFYTIADNAVTDDGQQPPAASDAIPAVGASSPDDAVRSMLQALIGGDARRAIELLSPDEMQVMHDYGKAIIAKSNLHGGSASLKDIQFTDSKVDGGTKVSLKSMQIGGPGGQTISVEINGSCLKVTANGQNRSVCGSEILQGIGRSSGGISLTAAQRAALTHLFAGISKVGVITTEHDGKWYVNPVRSFAEVGTTLLGGLHDGDMQALLSLAHR